MKKKSRIFLFKKVCVSQTFVIIWKLKTLEYVNSRANQNTLYEFEGKSERTNNWFLVDDKWIEINTITKDPEFYWNSIKGHAH